MNKKDILIDFSIYLLLFGDEFHNHELQLFHTGEKIEVSYEYYVIAINKLIDVEGFLWDTDINKPVSKIRTFNELISEKEIELFQEYINTEFYFGYPDEINEDGFAWGPTYNLNLTLSDINSYFKDYINLRKLNPSQYITYYIQYLNFLASQSNQIMQIAMNEINNVHNNKISTPIETYTKLKDKLESQLLDNLLRCTQNTLFQVQGGFDDNGFILNYENTLKTILKAHNSKYSKINFEIELEQYYALIKYEYYSFKIEGKKTNTTIEEEEKLKSQFETLKKDNEKQILYLKRMGFNNTEVNIILNCFSLNQFNSCGIRNIRNLSQVDYFGLFYFFYRFEFLKEKEGLKFDNERDFDFLPLSKTINKNDYKKYYVHSNDTIISYENPHKRYPFKNAKKLLRQIELELHINLDKLNLPEELKKSL
ncbi:MAG: hypothetical protein Aureis2KO_05690 [Aureisphaera sp.]